MGIQNQRYITYAEAQELYGVSQMTFNRLVRSGVIEVFRPGKKTLLDAVSVIGGSSRPRSRSSGDDACRRVATMRYCQGLSGCIVATIAIFKSGGCR